MEIKVKRFLGRTSLWAGGYQQSGPLVKKVWEKGISAVPGETTINSILVLGLGAGSAVPVLTKRYPHAVITGVEINLKMVDLGKKYFGLDRYPALKIILADAFQFINKLKSGNFDLILVDLYRGGVFPKKFLTAPFLGNLKKNLNPGGLMIFNQSVFGKKAVALKAFREKLAKVLAIKGEVEEKYNRLIIVS